MRPVAEYTVSLWLVINMALMPVVSVLAIPVSVSASYGKVTYLATRHQADSTDAEDDDTVHATGVHFWMKCRRACLNLEDILYCFCMHFAHLPVISPPLPLAALPGTGDSYSSGLFDGYAGWMPSRVLRPPIR